MRKGNGLCCAKPSELIAGLFLFIYLLLLLFFFYRQGYFCFYTSVIMTNPIGPHTRRKGMCRMLLFSALPPLLLFVLFCCTAANSVAAVHRCGYDRISKNRGGPQPDAMVVELPQKGRSGVSVLAAASTENNGWAPIRMKLFYEDLKDESRYCTKAGDIRRSYEDGKMYTCEESDVLTEAKKSILVNQLLPGAIKLHSDRLFVQTVTGNIVVPYDTYDKCLRFMIPSSHYTVGVESTDLVLYVAAGVNVVESVAWAMYCSSDHNGRPTAGVIHFNTHYIALNDVMVRLAAHEIGHVLGFDFYKIKARGMFKTLTDGSIRGKPRVNLATSPKTVEKAREHYNCTNIAGMELEDGSGRHKPISHWLYRNAKDELMSSAMGAGYYTSLTLALFEDLGFYRANWSMAETMAWGKNAGCEFLENKCVTDGISNFPDMFCTELNTPDNYHTCVSDRSGLGKCNNKIHEEPIPQHFQYFDSPLIGGPAKVVDYCPFISTDFKGARCDDTSKTMLGSRFGKNSKCLKGNNLQYNNISIGDVCAEIKCGDGTVSVRYHGNETPHDCPDGEVITLDGNFMKGAIVCPKYHEVCMEVGADKTPVNLSSPDTIILLRVEDDEVTRALRKMAARAAMNSVDQWDRVLAANEDFAKNVSDLESSFNNVLDHIKILKINATLMNISTNGALLGKLDDLNTTITNAREAATALKNAEATMLTLQERRDFEKKIKKTWSILWFGRLYEKKEGAKKAAELWDKIRAALLLQVGEADKTLTKIDEALDKAAEAIKLLEGSTDDSADTVHDALNSIKRNLSSLKTKALTIRTVSTESYGLAGDVAITCRKCVAQAEKWESDE